MNLLERKFQNNPSHRQKGEGKQMEFCPTCRSRVLIYSVKINGVKLKEKRCRACYKVIKIISQDGLSRDLSKAFARRRDCPVCGGQLFFYPTIILEKKIKLWKERCRDCSKAFNVVKEETLSDYELKELLRGRKKPIKFLPPKKIYDWFYAGKKDYDYAFLKYLEDQLRTQRNVAIVSTLEYGFFYKANGIVIWEVPRYGNATYFFHGDLSIVDAVIAIVDSLGKTAILYDAKLRKKIGFIDRLWHNYYDVDLWKRNVSELLNSLLKKID